MNRRVTAASAAAILMLTASCGFFRGSGAPTTEQRSISGVTAVRLLTSGNLTITPGSTETLSVTADSDRLVGLTSQVIDGTLILDNKSNTNSAGEIHYALTVPPLRSVKLSGSGGAEGVGVLASAADVAVSGSGGAILKGLDLTGVVVDLTGSGDVELAGKARTQQVTGTSSGNYRGSVLLTERTTVRVGGSGSAQVNASGTLSAKATSSGSITYLGNPARVDKSTTGSGDITAG